MTAAEAARDAETAEALGRTVTGRGWVAGGLQGGGLSTLDATTRPVDALRAAGLAPLVGHVRPLQDVVDRMAGKAAAVRSFADTWTRVATDTDEVRQRLDRTARDETAEWTGATADRYRARAGVLVEALRGTVALSTAMAHAATAMGETVAAARGHAHRQLEELVRRLTDYVTRASAAEGGFTANVMAQATKLIDSYARPIADHERALRQTVDTFEAHVSANGLAPQWTKSRDWFTAKADTATTPAGGPTPPGQDERNWLGRGGAYLDGDKIIIRPRNADVPSVTIPNNTGAQGFEVGPGYKLWEWQHTYRVPYSTDIPFDRGAALVGDAIARNPVPTFDDQPASATGSLNDALVGEGNDWRQHPVNLVNSAGVAGAWTANHWGVSQDVHQRLDTRQPAH